MDNDSLLITLLHRNKNIPVQMSRGQYHSLMSLISEHLAIPGFGLCSGMGSCGTCLAEVSSGGSGVKIRVLTCTVPLNDELANAVVGIPDSID